MNAINETTSPAFVNVDGVTVEALGYAVEWTGNEKAPFILRGDRGAVYGAMLPLNGGSTCYLINLAARSKGNVVKAKGNGWWKIEGRRIVHCW